MIKILCENSNFILAFKPHNMATVPLKNQKCVTLLSEVGLLYPEILEVKGVHEWEGGALHRLDNATEGLVMFARNKCFYNYAYNLQKEGKITKTYIARTNKCIANVPKSVTSYFRSFGPHGKMVKPEQDINKSDNKKLYTTKIELIEQGTDYSVFRCTIFLGFRHQIRAHLASLGCPIKGDRLYNMSLTDTDEILNLSCVGISMKLQDGSDFNYNLE